MLLLLLCHFSRVQLCATPWTAAHWAAPSMGFSRQKYWSGLPFPSPKLLYIEWINNKVLLYSTGNYIQNPITNHDGKGRKAGKVKVTQTDSRKERKKGAMESLSLLLFGEHREVEESAKTEGK